ncbi:MAG: orotidine-5'-phosphate decarboxylase [Ignavibacteria bacterium]|nr:orotidine-5'-phosphate decarboxylase [Ignavibacteria bacterium]
MNAKNKIIVALDVKTLDEIKNLVIALNPYVGGFKIGLELISEIGGPKVLDYVKSLGGKIFYDGKYSDIPNTTERASDALNKPSVIMYNVHINSGKNSVKAAIEAAKNANSNAKVLGVTVLTSIDEEECRDIYNGAGIEQQVTKFAHKGEEAGLDGIICSANDLVFLKKYPVLSRLLKVTPGIRSEWAPSNDQKRVATPYEAILAGADYLVIGRQITQPPSEIGTPVDAAILTTKEIEQAIIKLQAR